MSKYVTDGKNKEIVGLCLIIIFCIAARVLPFGLIGIIVPLLMLALVAFYFFKYVDNEFASTNLIKTKPVVEFSWGYVKSDVPKLNTLVLLDFLKAKDFSFYKNFLSLNLINLVFILFVFGDFILVFKNLSFEESGIYFMFSIFTKFVFVGYFLLRKNMQVIEGESTVDDKELKVLDIFYKHVNGMISLFLVLFFSFFVLAKYIIEIFFGNPYALYQSSLPFVLAANSALVIAFCVYLTANMINKEVTAKVMKVFATFLTIFFVFMPINYIDTVTYFITGSSLILSIFLYNLVIKKPSYIEHTYNLTF